VGQLTCRLFCVFCFLAAARLFAPPPMTIWRCGNLNQPGRAPAGSQSVGTGPAGWAVVHLGLALGGAPALSRFLADDANLPGPKPSMWPVRRHTTAIQNRLWETRRPPKPWRLARTLIVLFFELPALNLGVGFFLSTTQPASGSKAATRLIHTIYTQ
jgi:hypothetical protein